MHVLLEGLFESEIADFVAASVEVEKAVKADTLARGDIGADGRIGLQASAGADANELK